MSSASVWTRFLVAIVMLSVGVVGEHAYTGSPQQDNPTQEPDPPKRIIQMRGPELEAAVTSRVEPVYPSVAMWAGISGTVLVQVLVNQQGDVISTRSLSGHPLLRNVAATAARDWKFKPAEADGKPIKMSGALTIKFPATNLNPGLMAKDEDVDKAKAVVQAFPGSPEAYLWLANASERGDQNQDAEKALNKAIELKPDYEEAYQALIDLYQYSKATTDLLRTYKQALENCPNSLTLLVGLGKAFSDSKRYADAVDVFKRALEINPDDSSILHTLGWDYMQLRRLDEAEATIKEELKITPDNPGAMHNLAWTYSQMKRYDDAIATYQRIINLKSPYSGINNVYLGMGQALMRSNRLIEAIDVYNRGIEGKGDHGDLYCALGAAYVDAGRMDDAIAALKKGEQDSPKNSCICDNLGVVSIRTGKIQEAELYFRRAVEMSPDRILPYSNLAQTLRRQKKDVEAEAVLRQGIKNIADNVQLRLMLGSLLAKTKWSEAEAQLKDVLRADPNNALALNIYGYYLVDRDERLKEGFEMIERAVNSEPDNPAYLDSLGWAYYKLGRLEEAEKFLNKALQGSYKSSEMYEHLGDIYEKQGRRELAVGMWQKALGFNPRADDTNRLKAKLSAESPIKK